MGGKGRELYGRVGLGQIPHILSLVDRHVLSPTYGCFDRSYWHYRTASFPSGMYEEFVLPLALVYRYPFPGGEMFHGRERLRELVAAGIRYGERSAHADGSCDDYFPYERALGATAFSLYAATESYLLLELNEPEFVSFFRKRGGWLMTHHESGRLSNHHALIVLGLHNLYRITKEARFQAACDQRLRTLLGWQDEEGWFPEYEGCDPGYLTATIDFLAKYYRSSRDSTVLEPLKRAILFASHFMHPDGSYGGEYGSRNTFLFFPHGFELAAGFLPEAVRTADRYLEGIENHHRVHLDDDRMCAHLTYNHLQAYLDFRREVPQSGEALPREERRYWSSARLYVHREGDRFAVVSAAKGGVLRVHRGRDLVYADSGLVARLSDGTVVVSHLVDDYDVNLLDQGIQVGGRFGVARFRLPAPLTQALLHLGMLLLGRWSSDGVRALLQRMLIVGKKPHPMRFRRTLLMEEKPRLVDEIWLDKRGSGRAVVTELFAGTDHTSIYVAVSRSYQSSCLLPWKNLREHMESLHRDGYVRVERVVG
jgi:hypothetical protein